MRILDLIWLPEILDKIRRKHDVEPEEVEEVLFSTRVFRRIEKGHTPNEDLSAALGRSTGGRYLIVFFTLNLTREAMIVSARNMDGKERRRYEKE